MRVVMVSIFFGANSPYQSAAVTHTAVAVPAGTFQLIVCERSNDDAQSASNTCLPALILRVIAWPIDPAPMGTMTCFMAICVR